MINVIKITICFFAYVHILLFILNTYDVPDGSQPLSLFEVMYKMKIDIKVCDIFIYRNIYWRCL